MAGPSITSTFTIRAIDNVSKPARTIGQALKDIETNAKAIAKGLEGSGATDRFVASLSKIKTTKRDIEQVAAAWKDYAKSAGLAGDATKWTRQQTAGVKAWERQTLASLRQVKAEEQKFYRDQRAAVEKARQPGGYIGAAAGGIVGLVAAHKVAEVTRQAVEAGAERQHVRVGAMNAGIGPAELRRIEDSAYRAKAGAPNMSVSEIMELHKEARSAVQHPEEVFHLIGDLAKATSILKGLGADNANIADLVKGGESLGLMNDPARFRKFLEGQVKAMQVMGKTITTEQIYEAAKYTKSAGATLSDEFLNTTLPSLVQELHGQSAGDALAMLTKTFRGGLAHKHLAVTRMNDLGLLAEPDKILRAKKSGEIMGYTGKVKDADLLASDPRKWFQTVFNPAAEAIGIKTLADKIQLLNQVLPQTAANLARIFLQQEETLRQHRENYEAAPGLDKAVENQKTDAKANVGALSKAIDDLEAALTGPHMGEIGSGMSAIAGSISALAEAAKDAPQITTAVAEVTALGAAVIGLKAAPIVAARLGLETLAGALTVLGAAITPVLAILTAAGLIKEATDAMEKARTTPKEEGESYTSDFLGKASNWLQGKSWKRDEKYEDHFDAEAYSKEQRWKQFRNWVDHPAQIWTPPVNPPTPPQRPSDLTQTPAPPARPADLGQLDAAKEKAEAAKQSIDQVAAPVAVNVDSSSIASAQSAAEKLLATLRQVGPMAAGAVRSVELATSKAQKASAGLRASLAASGPTGHFGAGPVQDH